MDEDRSLDEFLGAEAPADPDEPSTAAEDADRPAEAESAPAVEPMAETFAWSPSGGECAACGATVEERWRDDDGLVCADCKAW